MPDKEQLSKEVNEALGTDMEFDRMLKDDLQLLYELTTDGKLAEPQLKQYAKVYGQKKLEDEMDEWYPGKFASAIL